jgi:large exoprotein involved in heme utilization and adhesion
MIDGDGVNGFTGISGNVNGGSVGDAGEITVVVADRLNIRNDGEIISDTFVGSGDPGKIVVKAGQLVIDGANASGFTGISTSTEAAGDAGTVTVEAGRLVIDGANASGFTGISTSTEAAGDAGSVTVEAGRLVIDGAFAADFTGIASRANAGNGDAGKVTVKADQLVIDGGGREDGALISGATFTDGHAGSVDVTATSLTIRSGGGIGSSTFGDGDAGEVRVEAGELMIDGDGVNGFTGISGNINGGLVGNAGEITVVVAGRLTIRNDGEIISDAFFGSGDAGKIAVKAGQLVIDGANAPGFTGISTGTQAAGDAGDVTVTAGHDLILSDGGTISSDTFTEGAAGTVTVEADHLLIRGGASGDFTGISSDAVSGSGSAGSVTVRADHLQVRAGGEISSNALVDSTGNAGTVTVTAPLAFLTDGGNVGSSADGPGTAGDVTITADRLILDRASISTQTAAAGGGEIQLQVGDVIDLRDSAITTSVGGGEDPTAGNITIDPKVLVIDGSEIHADAPVGFGGNVKIDADNTLVPGGDFQALLNRGDISASGGTPERAGTVIVNAPEVDLSGGLVVLEGAFLDTAPLRARCGARRDIGTSSFTGVGRGRLPPTPDGPLAGAYLGAAVGEAKVQARFEATGDPAWVAASAGLAPPCKPWN